MTKRTIIEETSSTEKHDHDYLREYVANIYMINLRFSVIP